MSGRLLVISEELVAAAIDLDEAIAIVERGFADDAAG